MACKCLEGQYIDPNNPNNCLSCSNACQTCFGPTEYNCSKCTSHITPLLRINVFSVHLIAVNALDQTLTNVSSCLTGILDVLEQYL